MRFQLGMGIPAKFWENMLLYEEEYIYYLLFLLIKSVQGISTWKSTLLMAFMLKKMMEKLVFFETCIQTALNLKLNIKLTMLRSWIWIRTSKRGHLYTSWKVERFSFLVSIMRMPHIEINITTKYFFWQPDVCWWVWFGK